MSKLIRQLVQAKAGPGRPPWAFQWKGRWHSVYRICNTWRIDTGWWAVPIVRDYYKVLTWDQLICVLYREGEEWFLDRVMD